MWASELDFLNVCKDFEHVDNIRLIVSLRKRTQDSANSANLPDYNGSAPLRTLLILVFVASSPPFAFMNIEGALVLRPAAPRTKGILEKPSERSKRQNRSECFTEFWFAPWAFFYHENAFLIRLDFSKLEYGNRRKTASPPTLIFKNRGCTHPRPLPKKLLPF